ARTQWVAWKYEDRGGPKRTKPPINPHTGRRASNADPAHWGTHEQATARAQADGLPGVGFVLIGDDNVTGIDLDNVRNPNTGKIKPWAREILDYGETYAEVSPSGAGIRLFARGKIPAAVKYDPAKVEVYSFGRYLTVTGQHIEGTPEGINAAPRTLSACQARAKLHGDTWAALRGVGPNITRKALEEAKGGCIAQPATGTVIDFNQRKPFSVLGAFFESARGGDYFRNVNTEALQNLSSWVPNLLGSAAKAQGHRAVGGYRVSSKDLGRPNQEDLAITSRGIVDWGVHDMGDANLGKRTPIDLVIEHGRAPDAVSAAEWLCERMGIDPASLGWRGGEQKQAPPPSQMFYFDDCATVAPKLWILKGLIARGECS